MAGKHLQTGGKRLEEEKMTTTTKRIVWACLINGICWVWCSYGLAYLGRTAIAESLSKAAITEIIGVVMVYCVKSLFENLSKHNNWPDNATEEEETEDDREI